MQYFSLLFLIKGFFFFVMGLSFIFFFEKVIMLDWCMFSVGGLDVSYTLVFDGVSMLFSACVFLISSGVFFFSIGYMGSESNKKRFSFLVFSFILSMCFLIFSGNMVAVLLGWDGLGLTSFLLVIYYQNAYSQGAGMITALTNRLGDIGLIFLVGVMMELGDWTFFGVWLSSDLDLSLFWGFLFLGGLTKSAQYPFSSWLPMAMAAPTPVSALVHSSTLVTAGVYLLIRFYPILTLCGGGTFFVLQCASCLTMVMAGFAALVETDLKKVVAYSTLSQLGVMVVALGAGSPYLAFFHLLSHAIFKALMFVCVGGLIHYHGHSQDARMMGGLSLGFPSIQFGLIIASLALCGFPFFSGFYSKDPVYELSAVGGNFFLFGFTSLGLLLTVGYSFRCFLMSQLGELGQVPLSCFGDNSAFFSVPVYMLGGGAIFWGCLLSWALLPPMFISPVSLFYGVFPLFLFCLVLFSVFFYSVRGFFMCGEGVGYFKPSLLVSGFGELWFLSFFSTQFLLKNGGVLGGRMISVVDQGWVEWLSGGGVSFLVSGRSSPIFQSFSGSYITTFFMVGVLWICWSLFF